MGYIPFRKAIGIAGGHDPFPTELTATIIQISCLLDRNQSISGASFIFQLYKSIRAEYKYLVIIHGPTIKIYQNYALSINTSST